MSNNQNTYELYSTVRNKNVLTSGWLNFGYWENTLNVNEACIALVERVLSRINPNSEKILDVGCGLGNQSVLIANKYQNAIIYSIDALEEHIEQSKMLVSKYPDIVDRVKFEVGDATQIKQKSNYFDAVLSIESAFHFNTRKDFLKEAYRVLKIGGKICVADCLIDQPGLSDSNFTAVARKMSIPIENYYDINTYISILKETGFSDIYVEDISNYVIPFAAAEIFQESGWRSSKTISNLDNISEKISKFRAVTNIDKYYIITASKNCH